MKHPIGICSWSLGNDPDRGSHALETNRLSHLHLAASAIDLFREAMAQNSWTVSCTMLAFPQEDYFTLESIRRTGGIVPEDCWARNRSLAMDAIGKTAGMGVGLLSFHAGFIDHNDMDGYGTLCGRMRELADVAQQNHIMLLMETGQETADDL
jgi:L-ribulose-5-phosphate 3-epimerase